MVSECANPKCQKPLHYLRDGKIFLLEVESGDGDNSMRAEHFWLCGTCSIKYVVKQSGNGVEVVAKTPSRRPRTPTVGVNAA